MTTRHSQRPRPAGFRQSGFTLLNVLISALLFGLGVLGIVRSVVGVTSAATQNSNVSALASLSDSFLGVVQANSALLVDPKFVNTFNAGNYTTAPTALQPWLAQATGAVSTSLIALPAAQIAIATSADSASGAACNQHLGCTVTMTVQWTQVGSSNNRSQTFLYHFAQ